MLREEGGSELPTEDIDRAGMGDRLDEERRRASVLGDVREAIFGAQDGLVRTLAVVSTVGGATNDRYPVLIAGVAAGLAGIFSMAAGGQALMETRASPTARTPSRRLTSAYRKT